MGFDSFDSRSQRMVNRTRKSCCKSFYSGQFRCKKEANEPEKRRRQRPRSTMGRFFKTAERLPMDLQKLSSEGIIVFAG